MKNQNRPIVVDKNSGNYWEMWGIPLFGRDLQHVLKEVEIVLSSNRPIYWIATVNSEFMMAAKKDPQFKGLLQKTNLNTVDGIGLVWARKVRAEAGAFRTGIGIILGKYKEELATGADLMDGICRVAEAKNKTVYFYGGWGDRSERTADFFQKKYPKLKVTGARAEDFNFTTEADILFVARGMKKQEEWIGENLKKLKVKVVMGVGRSFDYYSGELPRAPAWMRKMGLEWLYSLIKEPKRWRRQLVLPKFIWEVLKS
jgi:N-acetylglucosaminyldiphosphoundecaprenol N-acetyl-beta-D-mannosaminyltransferase